MRVVSDLDAIRTILDEKARYAFWLGAGVSIEAGVPAAGQICTELRERLLRRSSGVDLADDSAVKEWEDRVLHWGDAERRYVQCIRVAYPVLAKRVDYFRGLLRDRRPAFGHHATALLMARGYLKRTCLTTNFDHLLENAFTEQALHSCQPIRDETESRLWKEREDRFFVVKLHGDIDTDNILNTRDETVGIPRPLEAIATGVARDAGFVVLGASGNERSVRRLFEGIALRKEPQLLSFGLLWGVYMGTQRPDRLKPGELEEMVARRVRETGIHREIVEQMQAASNELFCFFPVWGTGRFLHDLIRQSGDRSMTGAASRWLDHEMRLRSVFSDAGMEPDAVEDHLDRLRAKRMELASHPTAPAQKPDPVLTARSAVGLTVQVAYGDITSRSMMSSGGDWRLRRAVVSPEDTFVSAGGGVAYQLLAKAGAPAILHELAKFSPIAQGSVVVTSGGDLPVHHIFHAAALQIGPSAEYRIDREDVRATMRSVLETARGLQVRKVWVPLLGAGVASLSAAESLEGIFQALAEWAPADPSGPPMAIVVMVYPERELPRHRVHEVFEATLGNRFAPAEPEALDAVPT